MERDVIALAAINIKRRVSRRPRRPTECVKGHEIIEEPSWTRWRVNYVALTARTL